MSRLIESVIRNNTFAVMQRAAALFACSMVAYSMFAAPLQPPLADIALPDEFTTVFRFDSGSFGVLDPSRSRVLVIGGDGLQKKTLQLDRTTSAPAGSIYPDQVVRTEDGRLYWLRRRLASILVFGSDNRLTRSIATNLPAPFWFTVEGGGTVNVYGSSEFDPISSFVRIGPDNRVLSQTEGWLAPLKERNHFADEFFFGRSGAQIELLAHFPYVRFSDGRIIDFSNCAAFQPLVAANIRDQRNRLKLSPAGRDATFVPRSAEYPVVLSAAEGPSGTVYALANGAVLLRVSAKPPLKCWSVGPPTGGSPYYYTTSVAVTDTRIAILTSVGGKSKSLRIWDLSTVEK